MNTARTDHPRWTARITKVGALSGFVALIVLAIAGPGYRLGILPLQVALLAAALGLVLFPVTFLLGGVGLLAARMRSMNTSWWAVAIVLLAGAVTVMAGIWLTRLRGAPPIHDITTDLDDPPAFLDLVPIREAAGAVNPAEYRRTQNVRGRRIDVAEAQRQAYPDLQPVLLSQPPAQALEVAERAARSMRWEIVGVVTNVVPVGGRIEATDSTWYFGFKDDVVIRVRPDPSGSRIDIRSVSRVGIGDLGTNARRVRAYIEQLRRVRS